MTSLFRRKSFVQDVHNPGEQNFGGIYTKDEVYMVIFTNVLIRFEVRYFRYQSPDIGFIGQRVVATIKKCRGCGHFRYIINRWRVLKRKKKENNFSRILANGHFYRRAGSRR